MSNHETHEIIKAEGDSLFSRIVSILEQARANVVRSVNTNIVLAYWMIGREIVLKLQSGEARAEYGKQVIEELSKRLTEKYGKGFSETNLKYFRTFYQVYAERLAGIGHPAGDQFAALQIRHPSGDESCEQPKVHLPGGELAMAILNSHPTGDKSASGFNPQLSWSHYRALMRVDNPDARAFYEKEAAECGWSKTQLERQIQSSYFERILKDRGLAGLLSADRERLPGETLAPIHVLKSPYVLEFLDLPDSPVLHEKELEQAIISNLRSFLLELGKGFSFVARQKHIRFDDDDFYVDLVFYNFMIKCFLLIDLKIGKLTHQDVGQMDGYVRLFEDRFKIEGDNPTIGLILCSDKSEAVAKYSVLSEGKQIFASKYLQFLPSEEELARELTREQRLIEAQLAERELLQKPGGKDNRNV